MAETFNCFINSTQTSLLKERTLFGIKVRRKLLYRERDLYLLITLQSSKFTCCPLQIGLIVRCTTRYFGWRLLGFLPTERAEGGLGPRTHPPSRLLTSRSRGWTDKTGTHRVQNMIGANTSLASVENLANYLLNLCKLSSTVGNAAIRCKKKKKKKHWHHWSVQAPGWKQSSEWK